MTAYFYTIRFVGYVFIFFVAIALFSKPYNARGETITVSFYEGYYKKDNGEDSPKYSALVIVSKNYLNYKELHCFRGSTLPNPYWVYDDFVGNLFDADGRLHDVFAKIDSLDLKSIGLSGLRPLVQIFRDDKKYPIVSAGVYDFKVVEHGKYTPRALLIASGGLVPTLNPNPNKGNAFKADEIFVHKGRYSGVNRDSAGCLTINPNDWKCFIKLFPKEEEWISKGYYGKVEIIRGTKPVPPMGLQFIFSR